MGSHRADVGVTSRPSEPVTPYVGKRRAPAAPVEEPAAPVMPYVGRRRATVVEPEPVLDETAPCDEALVDLATRAIDDTAPRARVAAPLDVHPVDVPVQRRAHESIAHLFADDSRVDIPAIGRPADFSTDQTAVIPLVLPDGGKRRRDGRRGTTTRRLPSLPLLAGVASLAIAVTGVVMTGHPSVVPVAAHRLTQATALAGNSGDGSVGGRDGLSRGGDRDGFTTGSGSVSSLVAARGAALQESDKQAGNYDAELLKNQWVLPISPGGYHLTGRFGDVSGLWATIHTGLDFACGYGTPIHAVAAGVITSTGYDGSYGNKTVETLPDGTELWYAHQEQFNVTPGQHVAQGQVIGFVGATGNTTGPHVHLEVRPGGGDPVDPDAALKAHGIDPDANQG